LYFLPLPHQHGSLRPGFSFVGDEEIDFKLEAVGGCVCSKGSIAFAS
jgi:hypothetical protein